MTPPFEILEHTADVGLRARGPTIESVFGAIGEGLAALLGAWFPGEGSQRTVVVRADDRAALLAAWVDELLYLREAEDAVFGGIRIERVGPGTLRARAALAPRGDRELDGVGVKAATYHRLRMDREPGGDWVAEVYLDV